MTTIFQGQSIRLTLRIRNSAGEAVAPTDVQIKLRSPVGAVTTIAMGTLVNPFVGFYYYDWTPASDGLWTWRGESTTPNTAYEDTVTVISAF